MNIYIWERLEKITDSYHHEAGVVVFASSLQRAKDMIIEYSKENYGKYKNDPIKDIENPLAVYSTDSTKENIIVFPDAGCC